MSINSISKLRLVLISMLFIGTTSSNAQNSIPPEVVALVSQETAIPSMVLTQNHTVYDQIFKVTNLTIGTGVTITLDEIGRNPWVAIFVEKLNFEGKARFTHTRRFLNPSDPDTIHGKHGRNGVNGINSTSPLGAPGTGGRNGQSGADGKTLSMPQVYLFVKEIRFQGQIPQVGDMKNLAFSFEGLQGGRGGNGGNGGDGGNGAQGKPSKNGWFPGNCESGPGRGGRGGNGGNSGSPGFGSGGSDAGNVYLYSSPLSRLITNANYTVEGGAQGRQGQPGLPGRGGKGGPEGALDGDCKSAGRKGYNGIDGAICQTWDLPGGGRGLSGQVIEIGDIDWSILE